MMTVAQAKKLAADTYSEYPIAEILDIGDRWALSFDSGDPPLPGIPTVTVNKETGEVGWLPIPPLENLEILEKGKVISSID